MVRASILSIGPLLHEKRINEGKGIREVAREIGISPATLSRVENGSTPHVEAFRRILDWLDMDMSAEHLAEHLGVYVWQPKDIAGLSPESLSVFNEVRK